MSPSSRSTIVRHTTNNSRFTRSPQNGGDDDDDDDDDHPGALVIRGAVDRGSSQVYNDETTLVTSLQQQPDSTYAAQQPHNIPPRERGARTTTPTLPDSSNQDELPVMLTHAEPVNEASSKEEMRRQLMEEQTKRVEEHVVMERSDDERQLLQVVQIQRECEESQRLSLERQEDELEMTLWKERERSLILEAEMAQLQGLGGGAGEQSLTTAAAVVVAEHVQAVASPAGAPPQGYRQPSSVLEPIQVPVAPAGGNNTIGGGGKGGDVWTPDDSGSRTHSCNTITTTCTRRRTHVGVVLAALALIMAVATIRVVVSTRGRKDSSATTILAATLQVSSPSSFWKQLGADLDRETATWDEFGFSVALSADGTIVAAGARQRTGNSDKPGYVRVFRYTDDNGEWNQLGADLNGAANEDDFGTSVALSANGMVLVAGAPNHDGNNGASPQSGQVRASQYSSANDTWTPLGVHLNGGAPEDYFGYSVALSANGAILAVGAPQFDTTGSREKSGYVRVFSSSSSNNNIQWNQLGQDLVGESPKESFGASVALSADGTILAVGAPRSGRNGYYSGRVQVFQYSSATIQWVPLGSGLGGLSELDSFGYSVALSVGGTVLAVGAPDAGIAGDGQVRVFEYNSRDQSWTQLGSELDGETGTGDWFGHSIALSANGTILAADTHQNDGDVGSVRGNANARVFQYSSTDNSWNRLGGELENEVTGALYGGVVALSSDGTIFAAGASFNDNNGFSSGHVRVFQLGTDPALTPSPTRIPRATNPPSGAPSITRFSIDPTNGITEEPSTQNPTSSPTSLPSSLPTDMPSTSSPSSLPSSLPTGIPATSTPTSLPTGKPATSAPTSLPSSRPTGIPVTSAPTSLPSPGPTDIPVTSTPTSLSSSWPTDILSNSTPTSLPSSWPTDIPSNSTPGPPPPSWPTDLPSNEPSVQATGSLQETIQPTTVPADEDEPQAGSTAAVRPSVWGLGYHAAFLFLWACSSSDGSWL